MVIGNPWRRRRWLTCLAAIMILSGCGSRWEKGQVSGRVTYKGQPLPEGTVMFVPENGIAAAGGIHPDGTYELFTERLRDGGIVGKNLVCVIPPYEPTQPGYPKFSLKYQSQVTSGWEVEIKPGQNKFDFDIPE